MNSDTSYLHAEHQTLRANVPWNQAVLEAGVQLVKPRRDLVSVAAGVVHTLLLSHG